MTTRILIADDEEFNRQALAAFLEGQGFELHFAVNGAEACERARSLRPDLILLDVMMPDIDGFAVCRWIRKDPNVGRIPVILITALDDDASRLAGLQAGADEFVAKPCRRAELIARVRTIAELNRFRIISEQSARLAQLYEVTPAAIMLVDSDGVIRSANRGAEALLNPAGAGRLEGTAAAGWFDSGSVGRLRGAIDAVIAGREHEPGEVRADPGGIGRILQLRAAAVPEGDRKLALLIFDDVTAEAKAREAITRANADLERNVRARTAELEEANTLLMSYASFVSHELRSPLTVFKGYLAMIEEGTVEVSENVADLVRHAMAAARLMEDSIENILQLARDEHAGHGSRPPLPVDPTPTVRRLVGHLTGSSPEWSTRFEVGILPPVRASAVVLERVFHNLLANAAKYSAAVENPRIEVGALAHGDGPVLFVRDNGVGFGAEEGGKLFREFSRLTTAANTDGVGLGLSFVRRLVSAHGGRIWAEGRPGAGATFFVQFPEGPEGERGRPGNS